MAAAMALRAPLVLLLTGALGASATSPVATVGHSCYYFVVYEDHCAVSLPLALRPAGPSAADSNTHRA